MMKKKFIRLFILIILVCTGIGGANAQTATVTIYYSGAQSWGCCNVCGTDYMCIGTSGCPCCQSSQQTKTFTSPVPPGNVITGVTVTYYAADCSAQNVPTQINGQTICTAVNTGSHTCNCGSCNAVTCSNTFPCGLPNFNYGGTNTLYANPQPFGTEICTQRVVLTFTYQPGTINGPPTPGAITGNTSVCPGQTFTYSIAAVPGATSYNWSVPSGATIVSGQGTTSITVTFGSSAGQICVTATNSCGTSAPSCLTINLAPPPAAPGAITGPTVVCPGQTFTYSISPVTGATTYNWSVPAGATVTSGQGTTSVTVTFGANAGNICVTASNTCGTSAPTCITTTLAPTPAAPGAITGPTTVCPNTTQTYSIAAVTGATTYNWTVPPGATITSGQGTTSITVTIGTSSGTVCVNAGNACGNSPNTCMNITVSPLPTVTNTPLTQTICSGQSTTSVTLTSAVPGTTFAWTAVASTGITGFTASGTSTIPAMTLTNSDTIPGTVTITITPTANGCTGTIATYVITVNPTPIVTTSPNTFTICSGDALNITNTSNISGVTFAWTASSPTGNITGFTASGSGTSITDLLTNNSSNPGTVVYLINASLNGCIGPQSNYTITVNPTPTVTTSPLTMTICSGQAANIILTSNVTGTTYSWTSSNTTGSISGFTPSGTGNINDILTNNLTTLGTVTYTITPSANGCTGPAVNFVVTVDTAAPVGVDVSSLPVSPVCFGTTVVFGVIVTNGGTTPTYQWQLNGANVGTNVNIYSANNLPVGTNIISCSVTSNSTACITGNPGIGYDTVVVNPIPNTTITPAGPYCIDSPVATLTAATAGGTWSGTGITDATLGTFDPATAGVGTHTITYTLTAVMTGCVGTSTYDIIVNNLPAINFPNFSSVCVNSAGFILNTATPAGGTYSGTGVSNNTFDPQTAGIGVATITYTYTDPLTNCTNTATQNINVINGITVTALPTSANVCPGQATTCMASGAGTYVWTPATGLSNSTGSTVIASPLTTTVYTVTGTDNVGCTGAATVLINVFPLSGITFTTQPDYGCKPLDVDFSYTPGANIADSTWAWNFGDLFSFDNTSTELNPNHVYANEGTYTATLTALTTDGCTETGTVTINVYTKPVADFYFSPGVATMENSSINMVNTSSGANTWYWNFDDPASGTANESVEHLPNHVFSDTGTFNVILVASSNHGCSDTTAKLITIYPQVLIFAPTAFTPDGNGLNEFFMPSIQGLISNVFEMHIFDRWGQEVYFTNEVGKGWDGRVSNSNTIAPSAVYTWIAYYTDNLNKKYKIMGNVTLVR